MPVSQERMVFVLLEKDWLRISVFGFLKVAQTNANKPIALLRTKINPLPQLQGDVRQLLAGGRWELWRMATSDELELARLQLEDNRASAP